MRLIRDRFPDAFGQSITALIGRVNKGQEAGEIMQNVANPQIPCGPKGLYPNPAQTAVYNYLVRIEFSIGGGNRVYRTITIPSNRQLSPEDLADAVAAAALAMQSGVYESDPKFRSERSEIEQAAYSGFDILYIECKE